MINVDNFDNMGNNNIINDNFSNGDDDNDNKKEELSDNSEELDKYLSYLY